MKIPIERVNLVEKDIEDWLWENPHELDEKPFRMVKWIGRQVRLPSGIADLVGFGVYRHYYGKILPVVVEIKNGPLKSDALGQVSRYADDVLGVFDAAFDEHESLDAPVIMAAHRIVLGTRIDDRTFAEARALDIVVHTFQVSLNLKINGSVAWKDSYRQKLSEQRREAAESPTFLDAMEYARRSRRIYEEEQAEQERERLNGQLDEQEEPTEG